MKTIESLCLLLIVSLTVPLTKFSCDAIVCYKCDSISLESCATTLNETELPFEDCKSSSLLCGMSIVDAITYRGCSSSTPTIGATYRKTCNENLCNKGVYPPGRLKCYQCGGDSCDLNPIGKPHPCRYHHEEDECYLEINSRTEVYRGCQSDTNHTISPTAVYCDYNGCNNDAAMSPLKCAYCDSQMARGCKMDLMTTSNITQYEVCEMDVPLNGNNTCFIYHNLDHVVRGCSDVHVTDEIQQNMDRLMACTGPDFCNTGNFPTQQCLECTSELGNDNCRFNVTDVKKSYCSSPEASSCYAVEFENWHVERGCAGPPQRSDINRQYECDAESDCNATPFIRCYQCSTEDNANCAAWHRPGFLQIEECQHPGANCVIAAFEEGITKRGCESEHFNCSLSSVTNCQSCQGSFCNRGTFPAARLHCYQCGSQEDDYTKALAGDPLPCSQSELEPISGGKQGCFEYFNIKMDHVVRGCASDPQQYYKCMLQSESMCQLCYTGGCNDHKMQLHDQDYANTPTKCARNSQIL